MYFGYGIVKVVDVDVYLIVNGCVGGNNGGDLILGGDEVSFLVFGYKLKGIVYVDLSWSGVVISIVDVYCNGILVGFVVNINSYIDIIIIKGGGSYIY